MKPGLFRILFIFIALSLFLTYSANATHLRAGEITVRRDACNSLKFWITVTVFTNTKNTSVLFGGEDDILDFGDGSDPDGDDIPGILVPETPNTPRPDLGDGIATASFTISHIYAANSSFRISYSEPNRNEGVVNMDNSVGTRFYIETQIITDPFFGCNQYTPTLSVPPIDLGCTGVLWSHNPGAYDLDGDSLSYRLVVPFKERNTTVSNYRAPNSPFFYTNYSTGNEAGDSVPTFSINPVDGTITWDSPGSAGEYNIAFEIVEWRNIEGEWIEMGFVRRDMQIIIEDCENERPDLIVPEDVCVQAGTALDATIIGIDPDGDPVKIEAFSEIFSLAEAQSPAAYSPNPPQYEDQPAELQFHWETTCDHIKDQPYQVVFKITDQSEDGPDLVTFKTWFIRVVGPPPVWDNAALNVSTRSAVLEWEEYVCENASAMEVWRRVDSLAFEPDSCQTGMPEALGYELVATVLLEDSQGNPVTQFTDSNNGQGLAAGALYCYRLVALYPPPRGGESYVSDEICVGPILADEAIITNVTVDRTGPLDGQVTIRWIRPFDADQTQFPPPYTYEVLRGEGFSAEDVTKVSGATPLTDSVFVDTGLNTTDKIYNYRVVAIAANAARLDTSSSASTVRAEAQSELNSIRLSWSAFVPWSNQLLGQPHTIYRGPEGATELSQLTLLTQVDVLLNGFSFLDDGTIDGPLVPGQNYCYIIETLGSYGNEDPILKQLEPLRNLSQVVCAQPGDTTPPCGVVPVAASAQDCETFTGNINTCENNVFANTVSWNRSVDTCGKDVAYYEIHFSPGKDVPFSALNDASGNPLQVRDTFYVHTQDLTSFAGCYRVLAVDRSGNRSELSEPVCFDNCPYYELPNVFTPNDDRCNRKFSAYSNRVISGEEGSGSNCTTSADNKARCARFVQAVEFKVFNRWGKEVYSYKSGGENTIFIDWDGKASDGSDLAAGVYYYVAEVTFISSDPAKRRKVFKDWVHILR